MDERIVSLRGAIATKQSRESLQPTRMRSCFALRIKDIASLTLALRIKDIASLTLAMTEKKETQGESV
jgi:hypothetical protein